MTKAASWLGPAARRAQLEPWALGWILSRLCELEGSSHEDLAAELHCDVTTLRWIFLCRTPAEGRFAEDVERIALRFRLDANRLAAVVRRADAVVALA